MRWQSFGLNRYLEEGVFVSRGVPILKRETGRATVRCGFCRGSGRGHSSVATCPSCSGRGLLELPEPVIRCAFCGGTGRAEPHTATTCPSCRGRGVHAVDEPFTPCPKCQGSGRWDRTRTTCTTCSGRGVVSHGREAGTEKGGQGGARCQTRAENFAVPSARKKARHWSR